jgi:hypothetical protein
MRASSDRNIAANATVIAGTVIDSLVPDTQSMWFVLHRGPATPLFIRGSTSRKYIYYRIGHTTDLGQFSVI